MLFAECKARLGGLFPPFLLSYLHLEREERHHDFTTRPTTRPSNRRDHTPSAPCRRAVPRGIGRAAGCQPLVGQPVGAGQHPAHAGESFLLSAATLLCLPASDVVMPVDGWRSWGSRLIRVLPFQCKNRETVICLPVLCFPTHLLAHEVSDPRHTNAAPLLQDQYFFMRLISYSSCSLILYCNTNSKSCFHFESAISFPILRPFMLMKYSK